MLSAFGGNAAIEAHLSAAAERRSSIAGRTVNLVLSRPLSDGLWYVVSGVSADEAACKVGCDPATLRRIASAEGLL